MVKTRRLSTRLMTLLMAIVVIMTMCLSVGVTANAAETVTSSGANSLKQVLAVTLEDETLASKYGSSATAFATLNKFKYKSKSKGGEMSSGNGSLFTVNGNTITFNATVFNDIDDSALQQCLVRTFAHEMSSSKYSFIDSDRQAIYKEVRNGCGAANAAMVSALFSDTKADMFSALNIFSPFSGLVGTVLGIGVIIILVLLIASSAMDIMYINFPVARNFMYGKDDKGGDKGSSKPWGVTSDAWSVVNECEAGGDKGYKNPNIMYFKRRALTYIVVAILILYLLSGQIAGLIGWLMQLVSGFKIS